MRSFRRQDKMRFGLDIIFLLFFRYETQFLQTNAALVVEHFGWRGNQRWTAAGAFECRARFRQGITNIRSKIILLHIFFYEEVGRCIGRKEGITTSDSLSLSLSLNLFNKFLERLAYLSFFFKTSVLPSNTTTRRPDSRRKNPISVESWTMIGSLLCLNPI